jgi:hypothetical protein
MSHANHPIKSYVIADADGRTLREIHCSNRERARRQARQFARTHDADVKLIEVRENRADFVVDIFRRQAREGSI